MSDPVLLHGARRDYAWGSATLIPELLGLQPDGRPWAEVWFGTHPDGATTVAGTDRTLQETIEQDPVAQLGRAVHGQHGDLPFLVKLLAAERALSIQVHPTRAQAEAGFDREEAAGVPRDAPHRNYRDRNHKPELICAVTEFEALCGFRPVPATLRLLGLLDVPDLLPLVDVLQGEDGLRAAFLHLLELDDPAPLVHEVVAAADALEPPPEFAGPVRAVLQTGTDFPGDVGVLVSLLLNHVRLQPGEAIFLGAGNVHAYLNGLGVEVMATSDNVLRAGLTPKHIDIDEVVAITDFTPLAEPRVGRRTSDGAVFPVPVGDFAVSRATLTAGALHVLDGTAPTIAVCTEGSVEIDAGRTPLALHRGQVAFVPAAGRIDVRGTGSVVAATVGGEPTG
jgi:mannose-6-phosphate isomerase